MPMNLSLGLMLGGQGGAGEPPVITASVTPLIQSVQDGDTWADLLLASATDTANYSSTAGTISSAVAEIRIDGGAWTALSGNESTSLSYAETAEARVTVTDSAANERVFSAGSTAVAGIAPVATGSLVDQTFAENTGTQTYDASGDFTAGVPTGTFSVPTAPSGVTINSTSGVVSVDTDTTGALSASSVVVRRSNVVGSDDSGFSLTVDGTNPIINTFTVAQSGSDLTATIDVETGETSYDPILVGVPAGESAPSLAQKIAGQANDGSDAEFYWDGATFDSDGFSGTVTWDRVPANYNGNVDFYLVIRDPAGNSAEASDLAVAVTITSAGGEILTEAGAAMLAEDGSVMVTEAFTGTAMSAESGDDMLTEDDRLMLTEA